ncbi:MAG TPA: PIN domain-containing protein [Longimicrobium sp.]|jgi:predicted nucleic acid-binding protein
MRIYLDMCSLQRPSDDRSQLRIRVESEAVLGILSLCESGGAELVNSDALRFEIGRNPHPLRRSYAEEALSVANHFVPATSTVADRARKYVDRGIKPLDALHLACAVEGGAAYFCTCDDRLLKRARIVDTGATRPVSPLELMEALEDEER